MAFEGDVVELGKLFRQLSFHLALLDDILLLKPVPLSVYLSEVLHHQLISLKSFLLLTKDTQCLRVDPEVELVLVWKVENAILQDLSYFSIL